MLALSGAGSALGTSTQTLPVWQAFGGGTVHRVGTSILTLPLVTGEGGAAWQSAIGTSALALPMWSGSASGASLSGASMLVLPAWIVVGTGTLQDLSPPAAGAFARKGQSFAMHSKTLALVQDSNNAFNSYARLGSVLLAANGDGLFVLGASTDNGSAIASRMSWPLIDEAAEIKRCARMVVGLRSGGDLRLSVQVDGGETYEYVLEGLGRDGAYPNRVKIGKGIKGRYWQAAIENLGGADFSIDTLDVDWEVLSRRVA